MMLRNICAILIMCFFPSVAFTWNDSVTHKDLSEIAANKSIIGTTDYLKNIGLTEGLLYRLRLNAKEQELYKWIREGAELEDSGSYWQAVINDARYNNHFHNPLQPWSSSGLTDWVPFTTKSAVLWAQDGNYQSSFPEGDQSWNTIRNLYYQALTSTTDAERQANFAKTFKGLGHQMHLIEDMAQPDHVRNDSHIVDSLLGENGYGSRYFETWAKDKSALINSYASNPVFPSVSYDVSYNGLVPITQLIDMDQYNGSAPSTSLAQGLAEYVNANFFSDDTIFAAERYSTGNEHYFPYPKRTSTDIDDYIAGTKAPETVMDKDGNTITDVWISKTKDGEAISHFIRPSIFSNLIYSLIGEGNLYYRTFYRDEKCHEDYVTQLIPRAVGYSAGLLNYFFRGEMDMYEDPESPGTYIIENKTGEDMSAATDTDEGTFSLYYDDKNGNRTEIKEWSLYNKKVNINAHSDLKGITVTPPYPAPQDNKYILVFKGTLGQETDAIAGKVVSLTPVGPYIKITEVTGHKDSNGNSAWHVTFSLKGDKSTDVHVMDTFDSKYTFSQSVIRDLTYENESRWYGTLAMNLLMRWNLSNGTHIDSVNDGITNTLVLEYNNTVLPRAQISQGIVEKYTVPTASDDCSESGDLYGSLTTWKTFYSLGSADKFVGQWNSGKWSKRLVSAFGYTEEELNQMPTIGGATDVVTLNNYYGKISLIKIKPDVPIGTYRYDYCTGERMEDIDDPLPYPQVGSSNEVIYEIANNSSKLNSWTLRLVAD